MTSPDTATPPARVHSSERRSRQWTLWALPLVAALTLCGFGSTVGSASSADRADTEHNHGGPPPGLVAIAQLATAAYQDVEVAEAAGYTSSIDTLGCFQNPERGGMGVHYIDPGALDATLDIGHPEALVYELDAHGEIAGLVAHEYIVPTDAWTSNRPPRLFGVNLHRHPTLPLWVLHAWLWKPNTEGMHADWNPSVRLCPAGVPIFGQDLPTS